VRQRIEREASDGRRRIGGLRSSAGALFARTPTSFILFALIETFFLVLFAKSNAVALPPRGEVGRVALTYVEGFLVFGAVHVLFAGRPRAERAASLVLLVLVILLNVARQRTVGGFDYGFFHDHAAELLTSLGFGIFLDELKTWVVVVLVVCPVACFVALRRRRQAPWRLSTPWRLAALGAASAALSALMALRVTSHEVLTSFARSALVFHLEARAAKAAGEGASPFPYVHDPVTSERALRIAGGPSPRPDVVVLFHESQSGLLVRRARPDGAPYTPVFDRHAREALSVERFYGSSVHSSRGHFATLCSLLPMYRGKEFTDLEGTTLRCLPEMLRDAGYATAFFSGTDSPRFEQSDRFFARVGFSSVVFQPDGATRGPEGCNAGIRDDAFYRRTFAALDEAMQRAPSRPVFAVLANASNHWPFDRCPGHVQAPFEPTGPRADYVASAARADEWLEVFFEEIDRRPRLKDAIVVVVGDHSFPADEHGIHMNIVGAYEEAFRTGFLLRWSGHVTPELDTRRAASQIDVAPTLVDLLGLDEPNAFQGQSLFAPSAGERTILMLQPFDGAMLVASRWPFKFVRRQSTGEEHLYDLSRDPGEALDRIDEPAHGEVLAELRSAIMTFHTHREILRADRVWPTSGVAVAHDRRAGGGVRAIAGEALSP
jgi:arylsulfatase A-like enzyme